MRNHCDMTEVMTIVGKDRTALYVLSDEYLANGALIRTSCEFSMLERYC